MGHAIIEIPKVFRIGNPVQLSLVQKAEPIVLPFALMPFAKSDRADMEPWRL